MEVPQLITDLAVMLTTAAIVTITFKRLRIPTILGYIVAGFIIGPHFPLFLDVGSQASIETWSEIGVVIILFHIGLEFDFKKLSDIGGTAVVSAAVKMGGVMAVGYLFGQLMGMTAMDSVFLGAMLSISSTVVIERCFSELGLEGEKYTGLVMGSLVMEDVIAVFMMVILTTIAAGDSVGEKASPAQLFFMLTYLVLWLVMGILVVPTFLDRTIGLMSDETLTLLSIGFCFLMALYANFLGFSIELGAFVAGSLFAGTRHSHRIEQVTAGIKDMFGSIFFLSVGMLVDPHVIATRWTSIVPIAIIAVLAKLVFATIGMMLSGQDMETSLKGGISLAPIGEFSFIIAGLGITLGVMDEYLYPVIVAASIITIIATPLLIRRSDSIVKPLTSVMPERLKLKIDNYTSDTRQEQEQNSEWKLLLREYFLQLAVYGSIMLVITLFGCRYIFPFIAGFTGEKPAKWIVTIFLFIVMAVFTGPYMGRRGTAFTHLWMESLTNRPPLVVMIILKVALLEIIAMIPLTNLFSVHNIFLFVLIPLSIFLIARSDFVASYYLQLEARFFANLNQKTMDERGGGRKREHWLNEDYNIFSWTIPEGAEYAGRTISELHWGRAYGVYLIKLKRGEKRIAMPQSKTALHEGDKAYVIGERQSLEHFRRIIGIREEVNIRTLREFLDTPYAGDREHMLDCAAIRVIGTEPYAQKPLRKSGMYIRGHCMILGIERDGYAYRMPDANMIIEKGDILWVVGTVTALRNIAAHSI